MDRGDRRDLVTQVADGFRDAIVSGTYGIGERLPSQVSIARKLYPFFAWKTPAVLEQYNCYSPIDASAAKLIRTYLALYKADGNPLDLAKAKALGGSIIGNQDPSGRIRTYWIPEPGDSGPLAGAIRLPRGGDWYNCMMADVVALDRLSEY